MAYTTVEGRQELLETLAEAIDEIGFALASLGAAYEQLDEPTADRLEEELFGPVQVAYGLTVLLSLLLCVLSLLLNVIDLVLYGGDCFAYVLLRRATHRSQRKGRYRDHYSQCSYFFHDTLLLCDSAHRLPTTLSC